VDKQPKKWRDTIDPYSIRFKYIEIIKILGYPHAANDVFYLKARYKEKDIYCFLKSARHIDANIKNEICVLNTLKFDYLPKVIEYGDDFSYIITEAVEGERLSKIVGENKGLESLSFIKEYGETLATLHMQKSDFDSAPHRSYHQIPDRQYFGEIDLLVVYDWLISNQPHNTNRCFIHGDFHYANILWKNGHINGILDFELAGIGNKEFDIAWAIILRPEQKFMKTKEEYKEFIKGYRLKNNCDEGLVKYYMAQIYAKFYRLGDERYKEYILQWYRENI